LDVVRAVTTTPAKLLRRPDLADLAPGSTGDATVLRIEDGDFIFTDVVGETLHGCKRLTLQSVVLGGRLWHENKKRGNPVEAASAPF
jgi:dihydroorotase